MAELKVSGEQYGRIKGSLREYYMRERSRREELAQAGPDRAEVLKYARELLVPSGSPA
jgi:hypothetical protein